MLLVSAVGLTSAQRPPYAGQRPTGYKDRLEETNNVAVVPLDNRFGGGGGSSSSAPTSAPSSAISPASGGTAANANLPVAALGDAALVNTLNQRPADHRPFWLINYEAIEAQKNGDRRPNASSAVASAGPTALPVLTNRFAADDEAAVQQPQPIRPTTSIALGSADDAGNFLVSKPEIVFPLPAVGPTAVSADTPTVIMLNGQPFLLTPLASGVVGGAAPVVVQQHQQQQQAALQQAAIQQLAVQQASLQQPQNWQLQREQPVIYFD